MYILYVYAYEHKKFSESYFCDQYCWRHVFWESLLPMNLNLHVINSIDHKNMTQRISYVHRHTRTRCTRSFSHNVGLWLINASTLWCVCCTSSYVHVHVGKLHLTIYTYNGIIVAMSRDIHDQCYRTPESGHVHNMLLIVSSVEVIVSFFKTTAST